MSFFRHFPPCIMRRGLSPAWELVNLVRLAGQKASGICVPGGAALPLRHTGLLVGSGFELTSSHIHKQVHYRQSYLNHFSGLSSPSF